MIPDILLLLAVLAAAALAVGVLWALDRRYKVPFGVIHAGLFIVLFVMGAGWAGWIYITAQQDGGGGERAAAQVAITVAILWGARSWHRFGLRGEWYARLWYRKKWIAGVENYRWFANVEPQKVPTEMDQRRAIVRIAREMSSRRTAKHLPGAFVKLHEHSWECMPLDSIVRFFCRCGIEYAEDMPANGVIDTTNEEITRKYEAEFGVTGEGEADR